jgi:hypothetical protein
MAEFVSATPRRRARQRRRIPKLNICYAAASQLAKDGGAENHLDFRCARSAPVVPPAGRVVELEQERKVQKTDHDGTRADARAGPAIGEAERRKLTKERWQQKMLQEAQRTMPPDRFVTFTVALGDPVPPRWAITELNRLDREVKRRRGSAPQQGSASGAKHAGRGRGRLKGCCRLSGERPHDLAQVHALTQGRRRSARREVVLGRG